MTLVISDTGLVSELQSAFTRAYPFLKLRFYRLTEPGFARRHVVESNTLRQAGLLKSGSLNLFDEMTVGELERRFRDEFGLMAQVSRRSGGVWLETTMTDNWTLRQQNEHGKEISE